MLRFRTFFTMTMFLAIGMNAGWFVSPWLIPCGAAGAVIIGSWLVEAKQSVIENMAQVLTRLFTPLFTILLFAFLATMAWTGNPINVKREVLISFDLLLAVIIGLVLYAASARDPQAPPDFFDALQLLLVVSALVVDGVALWAIAARISEFGFTPNRVAALGENLICSSTWRGRHGYMRASRATAARLPSWSDGRWPICPCTRPVRRWWLSCSRPCSATVDARPRDIAPADSPANSRCGDPGWLGAVASVGQRTPHRRYSRVVSLEPQGSTLPTLPWPPAGRRTTTTTALVLEVTRSLHCRPPQRRFAAIARRVRVITLPWTT